MRVLFDHNVDRRFRRYLPGHEIDTTRQRGWETLTNGALLRAAAAAGFEAFLSIDKNLEYEQNLRTLPLPVIVLDAPTNALASLIAFAPALLGLLTAPLEPALYVIDRAGAVLKLAAPRTR